MKNRVIKIRAWDELNSNWVYFQIGQPLSDIVQVLYKRIVEKCGVFYQFTGQGDKNGKEIYEGDICKSNDGKIMECKFQFGQFILQEKETNNIFNVPLYPENIEVIGNVQETPQLINNK